MVLKIDPGVFSETGSLRQERTASALRVSGTIQRIILSASKAEIIRVIALVALPKVTQILRIDYVTFDIIFFL
jgi:hypothetical protein